MKTGTGWATAMLLASTAVVVAAGPAAAGRSMEGTSLEVSADFRLRYEASDRTLVEDGDSRHDIFQRLQVGLELKNEQGLRAIVVVQDARRWGESGTPGADDESLDLHRGYVVLDVPTVPGLTLFGGRQGLDYGRGHVLADSPWANAGRAYDGVRARQRLGRHRLDAGYVRVRNRRTWEDAADEGFAFAVGHVTAAGVSVEPIVLYREVRSSNDYLTAGGVHLRAARGPVRILGDAVRQWRRSVREDWSADLLAFDAELDLGGREHPVTLSAGLSRHSGQDLEDDRLRYDRLYAKRHAFHGLADIALPLADAAGTGLLDLHASVAATLGGIEVLTAYYAFRTAVDTWTVAPDPPDDLGREIDVRLRAAAAGLRLEFGGGVFFPGDALADSIPGSTEDGLFGYLQAAASF